MKLNTCQFFSDMTRDRALTELILYAQHVAGSGSLQGKAVRCATIKNYVADAASLMINLGNLEYDPRWEAGSVRVYADRLNSIFKEVARFEDLPNRREPFTIEMLDSMHSDTYGQHAEDSVFNTLRDWFVIGLHAGVRKVEWAQEANVHTIAGVGTAEGFGTEAFTIRDVRWELVTGQRLRGASILPHDPSTIKACWLKWRTQKNKSNGEERMFTQPPLGSKYNFCSSLFRIVKRFVRLVGATNFDAPLAVFKDDAGLVRPVNSTHVRAVMRHIAAVVYNYDPRKPADQAALQKWSCHSLRVGACVILHSMGFTDTQIQWILRWKSLAFWAYLRNIAVLTDKHAAAFSMHSGMPPIAI